MKKYNLVQRSEPKDRYTFNCARRQTVTEIKQYTDRLFSIHLTRPASMRFYSGEFAVIDLTGNPNPETCKQNPLQRAYSIT